MEKTTQTIYTLGPSFSYSHNVTKAAFKNSKNKIEITFCSSIPEIFEKVSKDQNSLGVVPIENMLNGNVRETFFALKKHKVKINEAYDYKIDCHLAAQNNNFKQIYSHPQPIGQCSEFLRQYREKGIDIIECSSTSKAMEMATESNKIAAIGSMDAAINNKLKIIHKNIENNSNNKTRFILISQNNIDINRQLINPKTSMMIAPKEDRAGLLFEILAVFKIKNINLTKIESIPAGDKFGNYIFYIDIDANYSNETVKSAIKFLQTIVDVYIFGSYEIRKIEN